jgi:hypothetical protein
LGQLLSDIRKAEELRVDDDKIRALSEYQSLMRE